jgi:hypothetical protein
MELGNIIFGNSRGEAPIPREDEWSEPLFSLFRACGVDEYRGYPGFDNATFTVRAYDWGAECDCGFSEQAEEWHQAHPHSLDCYDSVWHKIMANYDATSGYQKIHDAAFGGDRGFMDGFEQQSQAQTPGVTVMIFTPRKDDAMETYRKASDVRDKFEHKSLKKLCKERGLTYPAGCRVHCDCYREKAAEIWFGANDHAPDCRLIQPNLLFKPTGFKAHWYKYPLRDSYMTPQVSLPDWVAMLKACEASVDTSGDSRSS